MADESITVLVAGRGGTDVGPDTSSIEVIGRVDETSDAIERVVAELPDVLVLATGIDDDDDDTRAVCRQVREWAPATRVLVLTDRDDEAAYTALVAGAAGLLDTSVSSTTAGDAVTAVARGESLLLPHAAERLINDVDAWSRRSADPLHPPPTLTATEREVLSLLAAGHDATQIADEHAVTPRLVNVHAGYAVAKLQRYVFGAERIATES